MKKTVLSKIPQLLNVLFLGKDKEHTIPDNTPRMERILCGMLVIAKGLYYGSKPIMELMGFCLLLILVTYSMGYQNGMPLERATVALGSAINHKMVYVWYALLAIYPLGFGVSVVVGIVGSEWFKRHINRTILSIWLLSIFLCIILTAISYTLAICIYLITLNITAMWCLSEKRHSYPWILVCLSTLSVIPLLLLRNNRELDKERLG